MGGLLLGYFIVSLLVVGAAYAYTRYTRERRKMRGIGDIPAGYEPTAEIIIDPTTGVKQRVWYNSRTGQRYYENLLTGEEERK